MIKLEPFGPSDFNVLISWIDSKELLLQIAGNYFTYPLTPDQLQNYLNDERSFSFKVIDAESNKVIGHSEIILLNDVVCKLDKILIGDNDNRSKGIGQDIVKALLTFSFLNLGAERVELYVYDWNMGAIKSYKRSGFMINNDKQMFTIVNGTTWRAVKMSLERANWLSLQR